MGGTLFFDPALLFVLVGVFMFLIGFAGCVGSLRENTCLLLFVRKKPLNTSQKEHLSMIILLFSSVLH